MSYQVPTSQVAAEMQAGSNPIASIKINKTAAVPIFPSSGTHTLVKILYASIDPIDYKFAQVPIVPRFVIGSNPIIPATTFVGRVWKTTDSRFKNGDLVWGRLDAAKKFGTLAEYTLVSDEKSILKVSEGFNKGLDEFAVLGVTAMTALQTLKASDLPFNHGRQSGGSVFINGGSGGVGTFTIQMAKHGMGVDKVVTSTSGSNAELVKSLGADMVIDYRTTNLVDALKEWAQKNGPFDAFIDNVGSDSNLFWQAHHYLKPGATYIQVGGGLHLGSIVTMMKKMLLPGFLGGGKRPYTFLGLENSKEDLELISQWVSDGKIRSVIEDANRFDLADTKNAYERLNTGRTRGKMVIKVADDQ